MKIAKIVGLIKSVQRRAEDAVVAYVLTKRNVALVDPRCGCLRSPDVPLSTPCPDWAHSRSVEKAFDALDAAPRHSS